MFKVCSLPVWIEFYYTHNCYQHARHDSSMESHFIRHRLGMKNMCINTESCFLRERKKKILLMFKH